MLTFKLFGLRLNSMTCEDLVRVTAQIIDGQEKCIIGNHNLHSLYLLNKEPRMHRFYSLARYIHIDGMSLVLLGRIFGKPVRAEHRNQYFDLLPPMAAAAEQRGWRIFYLGSRPDVAAKATQKLRLHYPGLNIVARDGYFDATKGANENRRVVDQINEYKPDILLVGMGMPRQEIWVAENFAELEAKAIFCCGGLMDLVSGESPIAPRWLGRLCLEWAYRLFSEPARLWRRYLIEPWALGGRLLGVYLKSGQLTLLASQDESE